jgi:predicted permease
VALIAAVEGYVALTVWSAAWLFREVRELGHIPPRPPMEGPVAEFRLRPQISPWAVLTKDLRIASRTPGYAFLLLLPVLDAVALGLITVADAPGPSAAIGLALGAVTAAALLATFFGPAFFAIEVLAFSYGRTLPLSDRAIIVGKVGLMALVYLAASGIVLLMALVRVFDPLLFVGFILAELPAIAAAGALELGWLFRTARRRGFPVVNLYSGAWTAIVVAIPGLVIAGAPLLLFRYAGIGGMAALSLVELAACAPVALARRSS